MTITNMTTLLRCK